MKIQFGDGSGTEDYRTCPERAGDCEPEEFDAGEVQGIRIAFSYLQHGVHSVVDPLKSERQYRAIPCSSTRSQRWRPQFRGW